MKEKFLFSLMTLAFAAGAAAQSNVFPNGVFSSKGDSFSGSAVFTGSQYSSHFAYSAEEDTYLRGGKSTSRVIIGDIGADILIGNGAAVTYVQGLLQAQSGLNVLGLLQAQNGLVGVKGSAENGAGVFIGTNYASHFSYSTNEDTYIRGGKPTSNVIISDLGNAVVVGSVSTTPAGYKLYVERGILTEKVKVALRGTASWSDYVFDKKYKLLSLPDVEKYIQQNKHLPGIPSAQQLVNEGGIDVNSMFAKQMEKIEELTLHLIEMNKQLAKLQQENKAQQQEIQLLKKQAQ